MQYTISSIQMAGLVAEHRLASTMFCDASVETDWCSCFSQASVDHQLVAKGPPNHFQHVKSFVLCQLLDESWWQSIGTGVLLLPLLRRY